MTVDSLSEQQALSEPPAGLKEASQAIYQSSSVAHQRVAIVCFGLNRRRMRRQPWHVAFGLASGLTRSGCTVDLITDIEDAPFSPEFPVHTIRKLIAHGHLSDQLQTILKSKKIDQVYMITGPSELARFKPLAKQADINLIMASPRLQIGEIAALGIPTLVREWRLLVRPVLNTLIPGYFLRDGFRRSGAKRMYYLSASAADRFGSIGLPNSGIIRPQIQRRSWSAPPAATTKRVTYFGPPLELRGAFSALEAFETACDRGLNATLDMLIRPDGGADRSQELIERARTSRWHHRIAVDCRYLSEDQLMARLSDAHIFLLPFKITISDVPLVIIEAGLSGRRLIVLDAPGVAETARALGGTVASSVQALPDSLIAAAKDRRTLRLDGRGWCDWQDVAEQLTDPFDAVDRRWRMMALCGVDGAGKTAIVSALRAQLADQDVPTRHVWSRYRNYLSKPLLAITRLTGHNQKQRSGGIEVGYHNFQNNRVLAWAFIALQTLDNLVDLRVRYRSNPNQLIVGDRCILDTLVDLAIDTNCEGFLFSKFGQWLVQRLPRPHLLVMIRRDPKEIIRTRPDVAEDRHFARRRVLYERLAQKLNLVVIDNDSTIDATTDRLMALLRTSPLTGGRSDRPQSQTAFEEISA